MARLFTLIISILLPITLSAAHLEFLQIPLTGSIKSFETKLLSKGLKLTRFSNSSDSGEQAFTGMFAGHNSNIYISYNHRTKQVYQASVFIECNNLYIANSTADSLKEKLRRKYERVSVISDSTNNKDCELFLRVYDSTSKENLIGAICIMIIDDNSFNSKYVSISYIDYENYINNEQSILEDL